MKKTTSKNQKPKKTTRRAKKTTARRSTKKVTRRAAASAQKKEKEKNGSVKNVQVRVTPGYYGKIAKKATATGHKTTASYVRTLIKKAVG